LVLSELSLINFT